MKLSKEKRIRVIKIYIASLIILGWIAGVCFVPMIKELSEYYILGTADLIYTLVFSVGFVFSITLLLVFWYLLSKGGTKELFD